MCCVAGSHCHTGPRPIPSETGLPRCTQPRARALPHCPPPPLPSSPPTLHPPPSTHALRSLGVITISMGPGPSGMPDTDTNYVRVLNDNTFDVEASFALEDREMGTAIASVSFAGGWGGWLGLYQAVCLKATVLGWAVRTTMLCWAVRTTMLCLDAASPWRSCNTAAPSSPTSPPLPRRRRPRCVLRRGHCSRGGGGA
jgi:hypothetical protein